MLKSVAAVNCQANISPVHLHDHSGAAVAALGSVEGCQPGLEMKGHVGGQLQVKKYVPKVSRALFYQEFVNRNSRNSSKYRYLQIKFV